VRAELAKVGLIPYDKVRCADFVEARPTREKGVDDWREVFEVLEDKFFLDAIN